MVRQTGETRTHTEFYEHYIRPRSDGPSYNGTVLQGKGVMFIERHKKVEGPSMEK
jgi:hypothetical protein